MKQLIFVVESDHKAQTDNQYIKKLIYERYDLTNNDVKIQFVNMGSKTKYNDKGIINKIKNYQKYGKDFENFVIYCFDTDKIDSSNDEKERFNIEKEYCKKNNYLLIWFNYNIEYVLLGKNIESSSKKREAIKFYKSESIKIKIDNLQVDNDERCGCSNIYLILDKLLQTKNK